MPRREISRLWLGWFEAINSIEGMNNEIKYLDDLIEMEKEYPIRGEDIYKMMIRKKILLQAKIKLLEEKSVVNG